MAKRRAKGTGLIPPKEWLVPTWYAIKASDKLNLLIANHVPEEQKNKYLQFGKQSETDGSKGTFFKVNLETNFVETH
ncbi:MAG: hypothetical protein RRZ24_04345 [Clostridia bacterium]